MLSCSLSVCVLHIYCQIELTLTPPHPPWFSLNFPFAVHVIVTISVFPIDNRVMYNCCVSFVIYSSPMLMIPLVRLLHFLCVCDQALPSCPWLLSSVPEGATSRWSFSRLQPSCRRRSGVSLHCHPGFLCLLRVGSVSCIRLFLFLGYFLILVAHIVNELPERGSVGSRFLRPCLSEMSVFSSWCGCRILVWKQISRRI